MDLNWIATALDVTFSGENQTVLNINTDTRTVSKGEVFVALVGDNFDGHHFVAQAAEKGAIAVIVDRPCDVDIVQFVVSDTKLALGLLGKCVMDAVSPKTIAITGSVGKTTIKEMCAAILEQKGKVLATAGNFNNEIGVPLTLLRLTPEHEFAVIELGANHIGEIAYTVSLTIPDVATVSVVAPAHIEGFGSIDGVGQAKGEIFTGLKPNGIAVFNEDCSYIQDWYQHLSQQQVVKFKTDSLSDFYPSNVVLDNDAKATFLLNTPDGSISVKLAVPGRHNVGNAVISAALTTSVGATLEEVANGLGQMGEVKGRVNLKRVDDHLLVIDDTYNANVKSVKAAIDLLADMKSHHVLVIGDMGELGEDAELYHAEVGQYANDKGIDALFAFGPLSAACASAFGARAQHFLKREELIKALQHYLQEQKIETTVLVKGSRSARMELVVNELVSNSRPIGNKGAVSC